MKKYSLPLRVLLTSMFLLLFNIITVSFSDEETRLTVVNKTSYYLHVIIDGISFLYVEPERSVTKSSEPKPSMEVVAFYSPGQGISGSIAENINVPYNDADYGCNCTTESGYEGCSYSPPTGGSTRFEVTPQMLAPDTGNIGTSKIWINEVLMEENMQLVSRDNFDEFCLLGLNWSGSGTSSFLVDDIILQSNQIPIFSDDFESYNSNTHPSANWLTQFSGSSAQVIEGIAHSGSKSFQLISQPNWARVEAHSLTSIPAEVAFEAWVYIQQVDRGAQIGFGKKISQNSYNAYNAVTFGNDNVIYFNGAASYALQSWSPQSWYHIKVLCNFSQ